MFGVVQLNTGLNEMVTCPFDPTHRVKFSRFHNHFVKCQLKYPNDTRKSCPFNYSELIEPDKLTKHIAECPYRHLYGIRYGDRNSNNTKIKAPCDVEFGQEVEAPKRSDFDFDGDIDDIDSVSMVGERRRCREDPDEIDSVSVKADERRYRHDADDIEKVHVIAERRRHRQDPENASHSSSLSSMINESRVNVGRGRAAFIKSLLNKDRVPSSEDAVETSPSTTDDREPGSFSFICNKNVRGEKPKPFGSDTSSTNSGHARNVNSVPKSQFLIDLRDSLRNPGMDEELLKKMGRGRGRLFR